MLSGYARTGNIPTPTTQYWQRGSSIVSPVNAGDFIRSIDGTNTFFSQLETGAIKAGVIGGDYTSLGSAALSIHQSGPAKQLDLKSRNLTGDNTVYFQNKSYTVADSAEFSNYVPLSAGSGKVLTGTLYPKGALGIYSNNGAGVSSGAYNLVTGTNASSVSKSWYYGINAFATDGSYEIVDGAGNNGMKISTAGVVTFQNLGTGTVQSTAGVLSVSSDSKLKDVDTVKKIDALNLLMKIPTARYWNYNAKSNLPLQAQKVKQFGLLADKVHEALGEEFAPTQPQSKSDSATGTFNYGLSDRALLSLTIQALQDKIKKDDLKFADLQDRYDALLQRVIKLEKK